MPEDSIFFAVKTWSGFHSTRARVVKKTWGKYVTHLQFFSDKAGGLSFYTVPFCLKILRLAKQWVNFILYNL